MKPKIADQIKPQRMKNEVMYAQDSARSIPAAVTLFRTTKINPTTKKRRRLTACKFVENLKILLGKQNSRTEFTIDDFWLAL